MNKRASLLCGLFVAAATAFAATVTVNDLAPFDNTIKDDPYWATTNHPTRTVEVSTQTMASDFNSKACSAVCVTLESFSSTAPGLLLVVR